MKNILLFIFQFIFFVSVLKSETDFIYPEKKFFIQKPQICKKNIELWRTIEGEILYNLKKIKYFKIFHYKLNSSLDLPEIINIKFKIKNCKSDKNFIIEAQIHKQNLIFTKKFILRSEDEIKNFPLNFTEYLKKIFPLTGLILDIKDNFIKANIGTKYDIKIGDRFLIMDKKEKIIGACIVVKSQENYSLMILAKNIMPIKKDYKVIPYNFRDVNKLNSFKSKIIGLKSLSPYKVKGLKSDKFKVFISSTANFCIIADSNQTVFLNLANYYTEKIDSVNYNNLISAKFSYRNSYCAYISTSKKTPTIKIFDLKKFRKINIFNDPIKNRYLLKKHPSSDLTSVHISAFDFSKSEKIFFFDNEKDKLIKLNIKEKIFDEVSLENKITNVTKIVLTPNEEKIIIEYQENNFRNLLIKDFQDKTENIIKNIKWWTLDKIGVNLYFSIKTNEIHLYNLYTKKSTNFLIPDINNIKASQISFSERFVAFLTSGSYDRIDIYDFKNFVYIKDIFKSGEKKSIKNFKWLPGYNFILIYGRLTDFDKNNKIDYQDPNELVMFDPITRSYYKILDNIDDFYSITPDGNFILYKKGKELYIYQIPYEKIFTQ